MKIPLDAMEYMYKGNHFLHKIQLCNPDEIAFEIMNAGLNVSWLLSGDAGGGECN